MGTHVPSRNTREEKGLAEDGAIEALYRNHIYVLRAGTITACHTKTFVFGPRAKLPKRKKSSQRGPAGDDDDATDEEEPR